MPSRLWDFFFFLSVCSKVKFPIKLVLAAAGIPPVEAHVLAEDCGMFVSAGSVQLEQGVVTEMCGHEECSATYLLRKGVFSELKLLCYSCATELHSDLFPALEASLGSRLYFSHFPINSVAFVFSVENSCFSVCITIAVLGLHGSRELCYSKIGDAPAR